MSKVSIQGDISGTGDFTIKAPNSNTDRTLNLPDEAGTVLTNVSDISAANLTGDVAAERITGALNATGSAPVYACRAWVNFDGTNTTIRDSGNVSSITDTDTGKYSVNFATDMPDGNYSITFGAKNEGDFGGHCHISFGTTPSASSFDMQTSTTRNEASADSSIICVSVFR